MWCSRDSQRRRAFSACLRVTTPCFRRENDEQGDVHLNGQEARDTDDGQGVFMLTHTGEKSACLQIMKDQT